MCSSDLLYYIALLYTVLYGTVSYYVVLQCTVLKPRCVAGSGLVLNSPTSKSQRRDFIEGIQHMMSADSQLLITLQTTRNHPGRANKPAWQKIANWVLATTRLRAEAWIE